MTNENELHMMGNLESPDIEHIVTRAGYSKDLIIPGIFKLDKRYSLENGIFKRHATIQLLPNIAPGGLKILGHAGFFQFYGVYIDVFLQFQDANGRDYPTWVADHNVGDVVEYPCPIVDPKQITVCYSANIKVIKLRPVIVREGRISGIPTAATGDLSQMKISRVA